jgi:hypothetical protein
MSVNPSSFNSYSPIIRTQFVGPTPTTHPTAPSEIIKIRVMTQARILDCARLINDAEYNEGSKCGASVQKGTVFSSGQGSIIDMNFLIIYSTKP